MNTIASWRETVKGNPGGLDAGGLDVGPLHVAGTLERIAALIIGMNQRYRRKAIGVRFTGI